MIKLAKPIYLCSLRRRSGKTFLAIGMLQKLQKEGKKVAYFKPIGVPVGALSDKQDYRVRFIMDQVFKTDLPYEAISPVSIPSRYYIDAIDASKREECTNTIKEAYEKISKDVDYVIIEGCPTIRSFVRVGIDDVSIAQALGISELVFVQTDSSDRVIDNFFFTKNYFKFRDINIKGLIFNAIDFDYIPRIEELYENHIKRYDIPIIGIIEKSMQLLAPRVSEIQEAIGGELINDAASAGLQNWVRTYIVGAMNTQAAQKYLRQAESAAVITGGDRADLILAALETDVSCLILTGFIQPDTKIITAANDKGVPILLSPSDTYTTLRNMERMETRIQEDELEIIMELIEKNIDWDLLLK